MSAIAAEVYDALFKANNADLPAAYATPVSSWGFTFSFWFDLSLLGEVADLRMGEPERARDLGVDLPGAVLRYSRARAMTLST